MTQTKQIINKTLYRSESNRLLAGVAGGIGEYFEIDPTIVRLGLLLLTIFGGSGVLIYIILWLVLPTESHTGSASTIKANAQEFKEKVTEYAQELTPAAKTKRQSDEEYESGANRPARNSFAYILILLGAIFLLKNLGFLDWFRLDRYWPVVLILLGFFIVTKDNK